MKSHLEFDCLGRRDKRHPKIYNIAPDYKVNNTPVRDLTPRKTQNC